MDSQFTGNAWGHCLLCKRRRTHCQQKKYISEGPDHAYKLEAAILTSLGIISTAFIKIQQYGKACLYFLSNRQRHGEPLFYFTLKFIIYQVCHFFVKGFLNFFR